MRATNHIRIVRDMTVYGATFGEVEAVKLGTGLILNGPTIITENGDALIGLAFDEAIRIPADAWEDTE